MAPAIRRPGLVTPLLPYRTSSVPAHRVDHEGRRRSRRNGAFHRELLPFTSHVVAVEPGPGMRDEFAVQLPAVEVFDGAAENLPLANASADVIRWPRLSTGSMPTRRWRSLRESWFRRWTGMLWNERDESVEWVDAMSHAILWHLKKPYDMATDFKAILERGAFVDVEKCAFKNSQLVDRFSLHQRVLTTSYIAVLDATEQRKILDDVDDVVASFDETFDLPYVTTTYCARAAR